VVIAQLKEKIQHYDKIGISDIKCWTEVKRKNFAYVTMG
jgi:hypothetical protein